MAEGYQATKGNVETFLKELKDILKTPKSKVNIIPREDKPIEYSTNYCLTDLGINKENLKEELKNLKLSEYVECCPDKRNPKTRDYYIFCKIYNQKQVYIKINIQSYDNKIILCMSFHYAEHKITRFPYMGKEVEQIK